MMRISGTTATAIAMTLALSGCGKGSEADVKQGQVVATVDGKEITVSELNAELEGANLPNEQARKQAREQALQGLVNRTILTNIARERKLDQSPLYVAQKRRAEEGLLVQVLQRQIASRVSPPTRQDAEAFISQNPDLFASRKVYTVDQLQFVPTNQEFVKSLEPLKTMSQVEQRMIEGRVQYKRGTGKIDSVAVDPNLLKRILSLPQGEIFVIPANGALVANQITGAEVQPFTGDRAIQFAMNALQQKRVNEALERELKAQVETKRKTIKYQPGFGPDAAKTTKS